MKLKLQKIEFGQKHYSWNWFIWFHEFFGMNFFKFSGPLCITIIILSWFNFDFASGTVLNWMNCFAIFTYNSSNKNGPNMNFDRFKFWLISNNLDNYKNKQKLRFSNYHKNNKFLTWYIRISASLASSGKPVIDATLIVSFASSSFIWILVLVFFWIS